MIRLIYEKRSKTRVCSLATAALPGSAIFSHSVEKEEKKKKSGCCGGCQAAMCGCYHLWRMQSLPRETHRGGHKKKSTKKEEAAAAEEEREREEKKKNKTQDRSVSTSFWIWARGRLADPTAESGAEAGSSYIMLILCLSFSLPFSGVCPSNSSALLDSGTSNKSTRKDWPTAFTDVNANELRAANRRRALRRWVVLRFPWELWKQEKRGSHRRPAGSGRYGESTSSARSAVKPPESGFKRSFWRLFVR